MAVYNAEEYVAQSIESILNQTFKNIEFIIIDDGSNDNSSDIIKKYAKKDRRINLIQNASKLRLPASLNVGIKAARGKYIARQDADDMSKINRLEEQFAIMEENNDIALIGTTDKQFDIDGINFCEQSFAEGPGSPNYVDIIKSINNKGGYIFAHGSAMFRREIAIDIGCYNKHFVFGQDREFWLRFHQNGYRIALINIQLYKQRVHPSGNRLKSLYQKKYKILLRLAIQENREVGDEAIHIFNEYVADLNNKNNYYDPFYMSNYWFTLAKKVAVNRGNIKIFMLYLYRSQTHNNKFNIKIYKLMGCLYLYVRGKFRGASPNKNLKLVYLN